MGVMLESNLVAGAQKLTDKKQLLYGQSITDPCMGWDETLVLLREIAAAVRSRRRCMATESGDLSQISHAG
jgi:3-deoxy-7-phosphoheptulonate synthase